MANSIDQNKQKFGEDREDIQLRVPLRIQVIGPDRDAPGAPELIAARGAAINNFVERSRTTYALSSNQIQRHRALVNNLDMLYYNRFGREDLYLRPTVSVPLAGAREEEIRQQVTSLATLCLMVLYDDDRVAAIPMSALKRPSNLRAIHKGRLRRTFGTDITQLMTAQYKFERRSPSVVFCPILVDKHYKLTVEDNYYLSSVNGAYGVNELSGGAADDLSTISQELADGASGTALIGSVKSSTPRAHKSQSGDPAQDAPIFPVINGDTAGQTVYTPLDSFPIDRGKVGQARSAGDPEQKSYPYAISPAGDYYYSPVWNNSSGFVSPIFILLGNDWIQPNFDAPPNPVYGLPDPPPDYLSKAINDELPAITSTTSYISLGRGLYLKSAATGGLSVAVVHSALMKLDSTGISVYRSDFGDTVPYVFYKGTDGLTTDMVSIEASNHGGEILTSVPDGKLGVFGATVNESVDGSSAIFLEPFPPSLGQNSGEMYYSLFNHGSSNIEIHTPYGSFSGQKFTPWLHVSNGKHFIQGFKVDDELHLFCDKTSCGKALASALNTQIDKIKTMIMDVPLGTIKLLR